MVLALAGTVLCFAIVWMAFGEDRTALSRHGKSLSGLLPTGDIDGWSGALEPIAESREMTTATWNVLRYDDVAYASYRRGVDHMTVFCAYWKPGSMSYRSVAGHNPEVCWPGQGWKCTGKEVATLAPAGWRWSFPKTRLQSYMMHGVTEYVLFWHLVDGRVFIPTTPSYTGMTFIPDLFRIGVRQRNEQYFVRISSNLPFNHFTEVEALRLVLENFSTRGVIEVERRSG